MAVLVRSCCCGCSLKTGVLVIALLGLIGGGYNTYSSFSNAIGLSRASDEVLSPPSAKNLPVLTNLLYTSGAFSIIEVLTCFALLAACGLKDRFFVLPYIVLHIILLGYTLGVAIYFMVVWNSIDLIVSLTISWLLSIYFLIVVYSFYESLREDPSGVNAGFFPDNPTVAAPNANYAV
ncbi:PREDICTED: uncharacterized protein LOC107336505 isoform X4 [Acropora digitifera]|uniref:uncharacterized protein LOC107336505 isoform X4 n=1 Tax=Acropora digitifera TaxID=70779 RepID=UPI00077AAED7|nr:PREDICTED: uncharacterized protein LOC107336505 isoform X4 [Acropora digitifera]